MCELLRANNVPEEIMKLLSGAKEKVVSFRGQRWLLRFEVSVDVDATATKHNTVTLNSGQVAGAKEAVGSYGPVLDGLEFRSV